LLLTAGGIKGYYTWGNALPALHAFTGFDYAAAFVRKGKVRLFEVMQKSKDFITAFGKSRARMHDAGLAYAWTSSYVGTN